MGSRITASRVSPAGLLRRPRRVGRAMQSDGSSDDSNGNGPSPGRSHGRDRGESRPLLVLLADPQLGSAVRAQPGPLALSGD